MTVVLLFYYALHLTNDLHYHSFKWIMEKLCCHFLFCHILKLRINYVWISWTTTKGLIFFLIHLFNLSCIMLLGLFAVKSASVTPCPPLSPRQAAQDPTSLCVTRTHALYAWSSRWRRIDAPGSDSGCLLAPQPRGSRRRMRRPVRATPTQPVAAATTASTSALSTLAVSLLYNFAIY